MAAQGKATHTQIETEFDRFLLDLDGKKPPYLQDISGHIRMTPGECETVSGFYHQVSAGSIKKSVDNMATATRLLIIPQSRRRELVGKLLQIAGPQVSGRLMTVRPNRSCSNLDPSLLRLYEMAMDRYPVLLEQVRNHLRHNAPLGTDFSVPFG
jgi:hypothetical protein